MTDKDDNSATFHSCEHYVDFSIRQDVEMAAKFMQKSNNESGTTRAQWKMTDSCGGYGGLVGAGCQCDVRS